MPSLHRCGMRVAGGMNAAPTLPRRVGRRMFGPTMSDSGSKNGRRPGLAALALAAALTGAAGHADRRGGGGVTVAPGTPGAAPAAPAVRDTAGGGRVSA